MKYFKGCYGILAKEDSVPTNSHPDHYNFVLKLYWKERSAFLFNNESVHAYRNAVIKIFKIFNIPECVSTHDLYFWDIPGNDLKKNTDLIEKT